MKSSPTLTATTSGLFSVTAAAATQLAVIAQPNAVVQPGGTFGFTVQVEDQSGNLVTTYSGPVTAILGANPGNDVLQGTTTVNAVAGIATFSGLTLNIQASGYTLEAISGNLSPATTNTFNVAINPPTHLAITLPPAPTSGFPAGSTLGGIVVMVEDALGNAVPSYTGPVTLSLSSAPPARRSPPRRAPPPSLSAARAT